MVVGEDPQELSGSQWAANHGHRARGRLGPVDLEAAAKTADTVRSLVIDGLVAGAHDVSGGGLATAVSEMAVTSSVGFTVTGMSSHVDLFSEDAGRVVLCVEDASLDNVLARLDSSGVNHRVIGRSGGDRLAVEGHFDLGIDEATTTWRDRIPKALGN